MNQSVLGTQAQGVAEKHMVLDEAISRLAQIHRRLECLKDRIQGGGPDPKVASESDRPCATLASVLSDGSDEISSFIDVAKGHINEIESLLFLTVRAKE